MRKMSSEEKKRRGCKYCIDRASVAGRNGNGGLCPFDSCQYQELDAYDSYEAYMASEDCIIRTEDFFTTKPACYELSSSNRSIRRYFHEGAMG